jgi:vacuolar-type H+-ATPase subunit I/STV1
MAIWSEIHRLRAEQAEWTKRSFQIISDLEREIARMSIVGDEGRLEIDKKLEQLDQLNEKLEEAKEEIVQKQLALAGVIELKERLENEQNEKRDTAEAYTAGKAHVARVSLLLDRKQRVIADLEKWCPLDSKVKVKPGMDEFLFLFDVIWTRNRDVAADLQAVTRELSALETENGYLCAEYESIAVN